MSRRRHLPASPLAAAGLALTLAGGTVPFVAVPLGAAEGANENGSTPSAIPAANAPGDAVEVHLRRAVFELSLERRLRAIAALERIDYRDPDRHPEIGRAALLLAHALIEIGDVRAFARLAEQVRAWNRDDPHTRWIALRHRLLLLDSNTPDAGRDLLSDADTASVLGRTIAGASRLEGARSRLERGEDPRPWLDEISPASPFASRARHLSAVVAFERGEVEEGARRLEALLVADPAYEGALDVRLRLAARAMDEERWEEAYERYREAGEAWERRREIVTRSRDEGAYVDLWNDWHANDPRAGALLLDGSALRAASRPLVERMLDLAEQPTLEPPVRAAPEPAATREWTVPPPAAESRAAVSRSARAVAQAHADLARARAEAARGSERAERRRRHLEVGRRHAASLAERLERRIASLDSLRRRLDPLFSRLENVHRQAERRLVTRMARIAERAARHELWLRGMRHFHIEGPNRERPVVPPPGYPEPEVLVDEEAELAGDLRALGERIASRRPATGARAPAGSPRNVLRDRIASQIAAAHALRERARAEARRLDAAIAAAGDGAELRALAARAERLERRVDSLRAEHEGLRRRVAREAVERALTALGDEREAIDYGLAASSYGAGLRSESLAAETPPGPSEPAPDTPERATWRRRSIADLERFLERHTNSFARGEARFRLADLLLIEARHRFQDEMASFLRAQEDGRPGSVPLPVLDHGRALALYETILREDPDFSHRDAVLFNAGMILADAGSPEAVRHFEDLVLVHPDSPFRQDAHLRLGDLAFQAGRYEEAADEYEEGARGEDLTLRVMALYKLGWSRFNVDRFVPAADAFRSVLDEYAQTADDAVTLDVEREAEAYLVHSLARAGGAPVFEEFFDRLGPRPYERRLLLALGQHFRRFSLFESAAAADRASLSRWPHHADALVSARRLIDTYRRWGRPDQVVGAQLDLAPRFAPGSEWLAAQASDTVRAAGVAFAREAWTAAALHHHRSARESGTDEAWRTALALYGSLLASWPEDPEAPRLRLRAGEASAELGLYEDALAHYTRAAESGSDTLSARALFQKLAVADAWYESTRGAGPDGLGDEERAEAVLAAGQELLIRHPEHEDRAQVLWRQGHLAYAHGRYGRAADEFERLATLHPADERAPAAASLRAEALFRSERFAEAERAFTNARELARRAGRDSLARRAEQAIPVCAHREAEAAVDADSTAHLRHAELFERVAENWPEYEHAPRARYRAGLAYLAADRTETGLQAMATLIAVSPTSEFARDAYLQVAEIRKARGEPAAAAEAYAEFADRYRDDPAADEALLEAAALHRAAGRVAEADELGLAYLRRYPEDRETAMMILEDRVRRALAAVGPEGPVSTLLGPASARVPGSGRGEGANEPFRPVVEYLARAEAHPDLASLPLVAEIRHREAEEARSAYDAVRLTLPLPESIAAKRARLDTVIARHRRAAEIGVDVWAHASAYRIGQALIAFGEALERSERPRDLTGPNLLAYDEVLLDEAHAFYERGEDVWSDLLRRSGAADAKAETTWLARARDDLWQRLGRRFFFRPEVEFPRVHAPPPAPAPSASLAPAGGSASTLPEAPRREGENR